MKRKSLQNSSSSTDAMPVVPQEKLKNWAGNIEYSTSNIYYPASVEEVQDLVKKLSNIKTLGTRHCFNRIADSKFNFLSSKGLNKIIALDSVARTVTVEGGIKYGELAPYLHEKGFALNNLASLPHISVAGSIASATHGSGVKNGNLAAVVSALEMVTANGDVVQLSRAKDGENFWGAVVGLGALGIVTKLTLDIEPTFLMRQNVYLKMPLSEVKEHFKKIVSAGYSVSLFTDWQSENINEVWVKSRIDNATNNSALSEFFGAKAATKNMHPIAELPAENCTEQMGVPGPWHERLPHFKMGFTPSSGKELQTEYFVPFQHAVDAILAVQRLGKQIGPHLFISEIRTVAPDNFWMSPCRNQLSVAIHFTWKQDWEAVSKLLPRIEQELMPFHIRPHWGKLFCLSSTALASRYEKLYDFTEMINLYDPQGKFRNDFLDAVIYSGQ